jgi:RNA recognition motif-containing protein
MHLITLSPQKLDVVDQSVRDLVSEYGSVQMVNLPRNKETGLPRGFCFVDVASDEELEKVVSNLDETIFGGRKIRVNKSVPKGELVPKKKNERTVMEGFSNIYVGNLPFDTTADELVAFYSEFGEVAQAYIPLTGDGNTRGFAFVTIKDDAVENAIEQTNGYMYKGRDLTVKVPLPAGKKAPKRSTTDRPARASRTKLYIGNLSFYTIEDTLQELFEEFGVVYDCYLPQDLSSGSGQTRGFGFVTMDPEAAKQAIAELDGCEIDGRIIRVNEAQPKGGPKSQPYSNEGEDAGFEVSDFYTE